MSINKGVCVFLFAYYYTQCEFFHLCPSIAITWRWIASCGDKQRTKWQIEAIFWMRGDKSRTRRLNEPRERDADQLALCSFVLLYFTRLRCILSAYYLDYIWEKRPVNVKIFRRNGSFSKMRKIKIWDCKLHLAQHLLDHFYEKTTGRAPLSIHAPKHICVDYGKSTLMPILKSYTGNGNSNSNRN